MAAVPVNAVERLADAAEALVADQRRRAVDERLHTPELDAELHATHHPLRRPLVGLLKTVMQASPEAGAFCTAIPRSRWAFDSAAATARMSCACDAELDLVPGIIEMCDCGRAFLLLGGDVYVDYPRAPGVG